MVDRFERARLSAEGVLGSGSIFGMGSIGDEWLDNSLGSSRADCAFLAFAGSVGDVVSIIEIGRRYGLSIVAQGGNTGRCDGATPSGGDSILLNMSRMAGIISMDRLANVAIVESGCVLSNLRMRAESVGRCFPLSLGSEGSCTIGGNIATNAGGINTVGYGNCREHVLGLEVVLGSGEVWDGLRLLRKDNSGYDLKHLFIGSEGTLGVITKASLGLRRLASDRTTLLFGVDDLHGVLEIYGSICDVCGGDLVAFEVIPRLAQEFVMSYRSDYAFPLEGLSNWLVLLEVEHGSVSVGDLCRVELLELLVSFSIGDGVMAESLEQRRHFWLLRDLVTEVQQSGGLSLKHDISLPIGSLADFCVESSERLELLCSGVRIYSYGHFGDGNLHYNLTSPIGMSDAEFLSYGGVLSRSVYDLVVSYGGSFSAEHGIGRLKVDLLHRYRSSLELSLQSSIKGILDPDNILNRGVIFDD